MPQKNVRIILVKGNSFQNTGSEGVRSRLGCSIGSIWEVSVHHIKMERKTMPTYISLEKFTSQGVKEIKDGPARVEAYRALCKKMGAELKSFHLTMGRYDIITIVDAPDDATMARISLAVSTLGNVSMETLRAFNESEYRDIIAGLP